MRNTYPDRTMCPLSEPERRIAPGRYVDIALKQQGIQEAIASPSKAIKV